MEPFIGQISITAFPFAPRGWALCNGQTLAVQQNQVLFSLLGTTYGGNGVTTFNLPDLRGRAAIAAGRTVLGGTGGAEAVALVGPQLPAHTHKAKAVSTPGTQATAAGGIWAGSTKTDNQYLKAGTANVSMSPTASGPGGQGQAHDNMPPMTVLNFIIALQGIYPSRT
jgi:microcystin-dependent protein